MYICIYIYIYIYIYRYRYWLLPESLDRPAGCKVQGYQAYPLIETRQTAPCRAMRGSSILVNSTLPRLIVILLLALLLL